MWGTGTGVAGTAGSSSNMAMAIALLRGVLFFQIARVSYLSIQINRSIYLSIQNVVMTNKDKYTYDKKTWYIHLSGLIIIIRRSWGRISYFQMEISLGRWNIKLFLGRRSYLLSQKQGYTKGPKTSHCGHQKMCQSNIRCPDPSGIEPARGFFSRRPIR